MTVNELLPAFLEQDGFILRYLRSYIIMNKAMFS